jgi:hypothetical protein
VPFSPNFAKITIRQDGTREVLVVEGTTKGNPNGLKEIYVGLAHGTRDLVQPSGDAAGAKTPVGLKPDGTIASAAAADAPNGATWKATISQTRPKVKPGEKVMVIGVGVPTSSRARPRFWHQTLTVK